MTTHPFIDAELTVARIGGRPVAKLRLVNRSTTLVAELLRYNLPLDGKLDNDVFVICDAGGVEMRWLGRRVKRAAPTEADYLRIRPGESESYEVDLRTYYDRAAPWKTITYDAYHEALSEPRPLYQLRSNTVTFR